MHKQSYGQWIESTEKMAFDTVLLELVLRKLPHWLEVQVRTLNPATYKELNEAVMRHMANQQREGYGAKKNKQRDRVGPPLHDTPSRTKDPEPRQFDPCR